MWRPFGLDRPQSYCSESGVETPHSKGQGRASRCGGLRHPERTHGQEITDRGYLLEAGS